MESTRLQYALKDMAKAYGFAQVEVIDVDLGMSAASGARSREGFKQLLASVALGEVGRHGTASRYLCLGDFQSGGSYCLGFGGATVDRRLSEHILAVISPQAVEASLVAIARSQGDGSDKRAALERQLQQARYEAERAFARYDLPSSKCSFASARNSTR